MAFRRREACQLKQQNKTDLLHFAMSAVNLNYRKPLLYVYAQDNQRCHETYSKANRAKLVSDLTNNLYFVRKA